MLKNSKIIVVKIGSSSLVDGKLQLRKAWIKSICADIAELKNSGKKVVIVTSGSVAVGRTYLKKNQQKLRIEQKQAAAAIGQPMLINEYNKAFAKLGFTTAQILLTINDIENRRSYLNAKNTFETLFENNIIPVVNENDSVATEELKFGDNDRLSALVAQMVSADNLIILSDIDGLYSDDPNRNKNAKHISLVEKIDDEIFGSAKGVTSKTGSGGMATKIQAAKIAFEFGCNTIIASGQKNHPLKLLQNGARHTLFKSNQSPNKARKNWIVNSLVTKGKIIVDDGAVSALKNHKSLLPIGIKNIEGKFTRGDKIIISTQSGKEIGKGITAYSSEDIKIIMGKKSDDIEVALGFTGREAAVHADDIVLI
jgi:glutamate 5-kinase